MKNKHHLTEGTNPVNPAPGNFSTQPGQTQPPITAQGKPKIDPESRHQMVASAAYYRAERRGFKDGSELADWLEAEADIDQSLGGFTPEYH